jgi:hypothetical protein
MCNISLIRTVTVNLLPHTQWIYPNKKFIIKKSGKWKVKPIRRWPNIMTMMAISFCGGMGFEIRVSCFNYTTIPFCSGYFWARVSLFAQACLDQDPPALCFPQWLVWQICATTPIFFCWDRISQTFSWAVLDPRFSQCQPIA